MSTVHAAFEQLPEQLKEEAKRVLISGSFLLLLSSTEKIIRDRYASINPDGEDRAIAQEYRTLRAELSVVQQFQTLGKQVLDQIKEQSK